MSTLEKFHSIVGENEYFSDIPEYYYDCTSYKKVIEKCCSITNGILQLKNISCQKNEKSFDFNLEVNDGSYSISLGYIDDFIDSKRLVEEMNRVLKEIGYEGEKYFCDLSSGIFDFAVGFIDEKREHELARQEIIYRHDDWLEARGIVRVGIEKWRLEQAMKAEEAEKKRTLEIVELLETTRECFVKVYLPNNRSDKEQVLANLVALIKEDFLQQIIDYQGKLTIVCLNEKISAQEIEGFNQAFNSSPRKPVLKHGFLNLFSQEIYLTIEHSSNFIVDVERIGGRLAMLYKRKVEK